MNCIETYGFINLIKDLCTGLVLIVAGYSLLFYFASNFCKNIKDDVFLTSLNDEPNSEG